MIDRIRRMASIKAITHITKRTPLGVLFVMQPKFCVLTQFFVRLQTKIGCEGGVL
jgi:hypothetical protein